MHLNLTTKQVYSCTLGNSETLVLQELHSDYISWQWADFITVQKLSACVRTCLCAGQCCICGIMHSYRTLLH